MTHTSPLVDRAVHSQLETRERLHCKRYVKCAPWTYRRMFGISGVKPVAWNVPGWVVSSMPYRRIVDTALKRLPSSIVVPSLPVCRICSSSRLKLA